MKPLPEDKVGYWKYDQGCVYLDESQVFGFDHVFGPEAQNKCVYRQVKNIIDSSVEGINGTVFMYG